jgi:drug/metabolite transporter (DMT)-like permease
MWCFAPLVWGLWAMFTPPSWLPQRLPIWGAILGLIAGLLAFFGLNLPLRVFGLTVSVIVRGAGVLVIVVIYYLLWMLVRVAYRVLGTPTTVA